MWTIWLLYYMYIEQLYVVYNNLAAYTGNNQSCLSINRREIGLHNAEKGRENYCALLTHWRTDYVALPRNIPLINWDGNPVLTGHY